MGERRGKPLRESFVGEAIAESEGGVKEVLYLVLARPETARRQTEKAIAEELISLGFTPSALRPGTLSVGALRFIICPPDDPSRVRGLRPDCVVYGKDGFDPDADRYFRSHPGCRFY